MGSSSRLLLDQSTYSNVADLTASRLRHGPRRDRRKIWGATASWLFSRLFSGRGWMRGLDVEVGENRG